MNDKEIIKEFKSQKLSGSFIETEVLYFQTLGIVEKLIWVGGT